MNDNNFDLADIKEREMELKSLIEISDKDELAQCVRLLAMYIAIYKKCFGELPTFSYEKILSSKFIDKDTAKIFENGMLEAITILDMVMRSRAQSEDFQIAGITLN